MPIPKVPTCSSTKDSDLSGIYGDVPEQRRHFKGGPCVQRRLPQPNPQRPVFPLRHASTHLVCVEAPPEAAQFGHWIFRCSRFVVRASARSGEMRHSQKRRCQCRLRMTAVANLAQSTWFGQESNDLRPFAGMKTPSGDMSGSFSHPPSDASNGPTDGPVTKCPRLDLGKMPLLVSSQLE